MNFEIQDISGKAIYACEAETLRDAVESAARSYKQLACANLRDAALIAAELFGAALPYADLSRAKLSSANISESNLREANLSDANLRCANIKGADLSRANLRGADLRAANLTGAYLCHADLRGANLRSALLERADFRGADLRGAVGAEGLQDKYRDDIWDILDQSPEEVPGVVALMHAGNIDGTVYQGSCACLVGSIAKIRGCHYEKMNIVPDSERPAERWFCCIRPGNTPANHAPSAIALEWVEAWQRKRAASVASESATSLAHTERQ